MKQYSLIIAMLLLISTICSACTSGASIIENSFSDLSESTTADGSGNDSVEISTTEASETETDSVVSSTSTTESSSDLFTDRDLDSSYENAIQITLSDGASAGDQVTIEGDIITISQEGTYLLSGSLSDGQIVIDADDTAKIQLVLNNVTITNSGSAAIYVASADKVFITSAAGSVNTLSSVGTFESDGEVAIDGTIFAQDDLTFNGEGTLIVVSEEGHGIVAKDDLKITNGTYEITAAKKGLDANDSVRIANGSITITAGTDAIHVENTEDTSKGYFYMENGTLNLTAQAGDGIDATGQIQIEDGEINILAGGGYTNGEAKSDWFGPGQSTTSSDDSTSTKGLKSDVLIQIDGGTLAINAADDSLHSNGDVLINNGNLTLASGDDGIHADYTLTVTEGTIEILTSHEGFEGYTIDIQAGSICLVSNDDGFNAAGSGTPTLSISGGMIYVNSAGDGLDSNGQLLVSGGTITIDGPTDNGNGSLDYDTEATITGGTIIALGSSGMAENFGSGSTQGTILYSCNQQAAGTVVTLTDANGNEIINYTSAKAFSSVLISDPGIEAGQTYTLTIGSSSVTIEMTGTVYGQGSGMGMGGMGGMGGRR